MKNIFSKASFIHKMLVVGLFLSVSLSTFGQDLIRGTDVYVLSDTSIVRGVAVDTVLIYNYNQVSTFSLVASNDSNVWTIYIEPIVVKDFEVFENMVFFCGYRVEEEVKQAVIGYFYLNLFPNNEVYYRYVDDCKELRKLDVYEIKESQFEKEIHLVSTGTTGTRSNVLIDMPVFSPSLVNCYVQISNDENESFDDVAVTQNYVVVSSRSKVQDIPIVKFWYYDRPALVGQSIFYSTVHSFSISSPVAETPVVLEHTAIDSFAAVYKVPGYFRMAMLRLDVTGTGYKIYEIMGDDARTVYPIDIKYNPRNRVYGILARAMNRQDSTRFLPLMQIYHVVPSDLLGLTPYGQGTNYLETYYHLWSLDLFLGVYNRFVISGGAAQFTRMLRCSHYQWGPCSHRFEYQYDIGELKSEKKVENLLIKFLVLEYNKQTVREKIQIYFPVLCGEE